MEIEIANESLFEKLPFEMFLKIWNYMSDGDKIIFMMTCTEYNDLRKCENIKAPIHVKASYFYQSPTLFIWAVNNGMKLSKPSFVRLSTSPAFSVETIDILYSKNIKPRDVVLSNALEKKDEKIVQHLIAKGCRVSANTMTQLVERNNFEMFIWMFENCNRAEEYLREVIKSIYLCGREEMLTWLEQKYPHVTFLHEYCNINGAASGGNLNIFEKAFSSFQGTVAYGYLVASIVGGNLEIFKRLHNAMNQLRETELADYAMYYGRVDFLEYLSSVGIFSNNPTQGIINGKYNSAKWVIEKSRERATPFTEFSHRYDNSMAAGIGRSGDINLFQLVVENNILPEKYCEVISSVAAMHGHVELYKACLTFAYDRNVLLKCSSSAAINGQMEILKVHYNFITEKRKLHGENYNKSVFGKNVLHSAIKEKQLSVIKYLAEIGEEIALSDCIVSAEHGDPLVLEWMIAYCRARYPNPCNFNCVVSSTMCKKRVNTFQMDIYMCEHAAKQKNWSNLEWLAINGYMWDQRTADICEKNNKMYLVDLAKKFWKPKISKKRKER